MPSYTVPTVVVGSDGRPRPGLGCEQTAPQHQLRAGRARAPAARKPRPQHQLRTGRARAPAVSRPRPGTNCAQGVPERRPLRPPAPCLFRRFLAESWTGAIAIDPGVNLRGNIHALTRRTMVQLPDTLLDAVRERLRSGLDRKSTRLNSSHVAISYAVFCLKKKKMAI